MPDDVEKIFELKPAVVQPQVGKAREQTHCASCSDVRPGRGLMPVSFIFFLSGLLVLVLAIGVAYLSLITGPPGAWVLAVNETWNVVACVLLIAGGCCWVVSTVCGLIVVRRRPKVFWWLSAILVLVGCFAVFVLANRHR